MADGAAPMAGRRAGEASVDIERDSQIRELAYRMWEDAGRPEGGADEFWYAAERLLAEEHQGLREEPAEFEAAIPPADDALAPDEAPKAPESSRRRAAGR